MLLSWVPRQGTEHYRVEVLAAEHSEVLQRHIVAEPELELEPSELPAGARWRVHCAADGEEWEPYVPPVALPTAREGDMSEINWKPTGAAAYRLLVRDDMLGQVVLKAPVIGPPVYVDWDVLAAGHPHRVRVQEWQDGGWVNLDQYRPLVPPPSRGLHAAPAERVTPTLSHAVIVRVSGVPAGAAHGERRPHAWLVQRLALLREWTVPALASALGVGDAYLVVCDAAVPAGDVDALREAYPGRVLGSGENAALTSSLRELASAVEVLAVTTMTAGDRLHPALLRRIHEHAAELEAAGRTRSLVTFEQAARLDRERDLAAIEHYHPALAHTVLLGVSEPLIADEALDPARPFIDDAYRRIADRSIVAVLRAWPGPNAHPALHGQISATVGADEVRAAFELDRLIPQQPAGVAV
jgi:hypothetical protein